MKAAHSPLFMKATDEWGTPAEVFRPLLRRYKFTLDGAATVTNKLLPRWLGPGSLLAEDALSYDCTGEIVWWNPPYSLCGKFLEKAAMEALEHDATSVVLIPSRTDTRYFHDYVWNVRRQTTHPWVRSLNFLKGRVKFVSSQRIRKGASNSAPFPSVVIEFGPDLAE